MHRIDHTTRKVNGNGTGKDGFTQGTPGTEAATVVTDDWLNAVQEELCNFVESVSVLEKGTWTQLIDSFKLWLSIFSVSNLVGSSVGSVDFYGINGRQDDAPEDFDDMIAVGNNGTIYYSSSGFTWTSRTAAGGYNAIFRSVVYVSSLGLWVIVGDAFAGSCGIQTSPDDNGTTWTARSPGSSSGEDLLSVCTDDTIIVAVGTNEEIQTSTDGITWTRRRTGSTDLNGVYYSSDLGLFCAVGDSGLILTSPDGITWTQRTPAGAFSGNFNDVDYSDSHGKFYAVGVNEIQSSADGITWSSDTVSASVTFQAIYAANCVVLAFSGTYVYALGTDGGWHVQAVDVGVQDAYHHLAAQKCVLVGTGTDNVYNGFSFRNVNDI